eukprot:9658108-Alexandrium_andersonii.AAC.1
MVDRRVPPRRWIARAFRAGVARGWAPPPPAWVPPRGFFGGAMVAGLIAPPRSAPCGHSPLAATPRTCSFAGSATPQTCAFAWSCVRLLLVFFVAYALAGCRCAAAAAPEALVPRRPLARPSFGSGLRLGAAAPRAFRGLRQGRRPPVSYTHLRAHETSAHL